MKGITYPQKVNNYNNYFVERGINVDSIKNKEVRAAGLNKNINQFLSKLKSNFAANEVSEDEKFLEQLNQAHEEWHNAELYFQSVTEPDLIDYAIYKMEASKQNTSIY